MFAERFDALMSIAEVSNSLLGRDANMNPSHIGRLRSGARPLPKKHEYLADMCRIITRHVKKDYQLNALQKLTGISDAALASQESTALYLEQWLLEQMEDTSEATSRLISGFSRLASAPAAQADTESADSSLKFAPFLYGNAGKRKAVEQFFLAILQAEKPQTLLLFSDENMSWLNEDAAFSTRWAELFTQVLLKGNRVKVAHTVSRNMNEMLEAITKWIPVYLTGMIEPYFYPHLRDGIFQRTLFVAPDTAAVVSTSVRQNTDGMLNLFVSDRAALDALSTECERYLSLCRPLIRIFTNRNARDFQKATSSFAATGGNAFLCSTLPPLFAMPKEIVQQLSEQSENEALILRWKQSLNRFRKTIKDQHLTLVLLDPECVMHSPDALHLPIGELFSGNTVQYTKEQYLLHIEQLKKMEDKFENLEIRFINEVFANTLLYVKESVGVVMAKTDTPVTAFVITEQNMIGAFWDYIEKSMLQ